MVTWIYGLQCIREGARYAQPLLKVRRPTAMSIFNDFTL